MQLLAEPIEAAPQSLQDRISSLEATIAQLKEENAAMAATQATLSDNQLIQLQLIKQLREGARREPQPMQKDRAEILHALRSQWRQDASERCPAEDAYQEKSFCGTPESL